MRNEPIEKLSRLAKRDDVELWFEDECHFQRHCSRCTTQVPLEDVDPVVFHAPTRKNVGLFGAVCAKDGRLTTCRAEKFNEETFLFFYNFSYNNRYAIAARVATENPTLISVE